MCGKVAETKHIKDKIVDRVYPLPKDDMTDTEAMRKAVREVCMSEYHVCGSVAMGDAIDSKLKLKGAKNIRVIDASAFPNHVSFVAYSRLETLSLLTQQSPRFLATSFRVSMRSQKRART